MGDRPITTLIGIAVIIFLAYLWRERRLAGFFSSLLGPQNDRQGASGVKLGPGATPGITPGKRGNIGGAIYEAEKRRRERENPGWPILDDTDIRPKPGPTWKPSWFANPYPNAAMLENLRN